MASEKYITYIFWAEDGDVPPKYCAYKATRRHNAEHHNQLLHHYEKLKFHHVNLPLLFIN
jgi:hypothetical protein